MLASVLLPDPLACAATVGPLVVVVKGSDTICLAQDPPPLFTLALVLFRLRQLEEMPPALPDELFMQLWA
jgi:hypothetical protein